MGFVTDYSLSVAVETTFGTASAPAGNYVALKAGNVKFSPASDIEDLNLLTGQVGAAPERVFNRRKATLSIEFPLEGMKVGYAPAAAVDVPGTDANVVAPWFPLLCNALGANVADLTGATDALKTENLINKVKNTEAARLNEFLADGVTAAGTDSTHIEADVAYVLGTDVFSGGLLVAALSTALTTPQVGFAKSAAAQVIALFEASRNTVADNNAEMYPTLTTWLSDDQPRPLTFKYLGNNVEFAYVLAGCICTKATIKGEAGKTPTITFEYAVSNFSVDKTAGGLVVPTSFQRIAPTVAEYAGLLSVDGVNTCGLVGFEIVWQPTVTEIPCHGSGVQGVGSVLIQKPRVRASFSIPHATGDLVYNAAGVAGNTGQHVWQSALELGTRHSFGIYNAASIGKIFAALIPSAIIVNTSYEERDGMAAHKVEVEAASYSGDTALGAETSADTALDSVFRVAVG